MKVGVGLPNTVPGTDGRVLVEWARRAERGPFSTVAVLDRLAYDSVDPFAALAAAAAVTERWRRCATASTSAPDPICRCWSAA
jgi:alkanesulfonate monooxygenase SsuD/methylene tetrahydromethanopterin reductase-like flavin-dependent oxidoreductase (luciferase family)